MVGSRITVVKYEPQDPRLGRHVEHDSRSKLYAFAPKITKPKKITTQWASAAKPLDQGDLGSCTATSMCQWLNTDFAQAKLEEKSLRLLTQNDAIQLYKRSTALDTIPGRYEPDDTGSTGNAAAKAAKQQLWISSYSWLFSFVSLQATIEKTPVTVGTLWTEPMMEPQNGLVKVGPIVNSKILGGHQYLMTGINWREEVFEFRQSWGEWDGAKPGGYFAISFRDFVKLLAADGDVTVPKIERVSDGKTSKEGSSESQVSDQGQGG